MKAAEKTGRVLATLGPQAYVLLMEYVKGNLNTSQSFNPSQRSDAQWINLPTNTRNFRR
jgi:hypothetical protein